MKQRVIVILALAAGLALGHDVAEAAPTAGIRGRVVDKAGKPIEGVKLDMEFKGESRVKVTRSQLTDKRGGFVRMGIPDGSWKITFTKEGYKPYVMEIYLSLGGFSEVEDVVLEEGPAAAAAAAAPVEQVLPPSDEAAKAGEAYTAAVEAAKAGRYDEAEAGLKSVIEKFPGVASAHYNLGYVYRMKKDWKAAEAEFARAAELDPAKPDALIAVAAMRELDGRTPEAAEQMLAAAGPFEQDERFQYALGVTCVNAGRNTEAEAAFRKVLALDPANAEAHYQLATIVLGQAKTPEAIELLEKYLGMAGQDPTNLATAKALIEALRKKKG
jgi:tetratricopeptide (TPR) repeat protein